MAASSKLPFSTNLASESRSADASASGLDRSAHGGYCTHVRSARAHPHRRTDLCARVRARLARAIFRALVLGLTLELASSPILTVYSYFLDMLLAVMIRATYPKSRNIPSKLVM